MKIETASLERGAPRKRVLLSDEEVATLFARPRTFRATLRDTARGWVMSWWPYLAGRQDADQHESQETESR